MTDNIPTDISTDVPTDIPTDVPIEGHTDFPPEVDRGDPTEGQDDAPTELDVDPDTELGLGIDVATAPELEDSELGSVLEALLLVTDTPVTVDATRRRYRAARLPGGGQAVVDRRGADGARQWYRPAGGRRRLADVHTVALRARMWSGCCSMVRGPS